MKSLSDLFTFKTMSHGGTPYVFQTGDRYKYGGRTWVVLYADHESIQMRDVNDPRHIINSNSHTNWANGIEIIK